MADAAACALVVIYDSEVVFNLYCTVRTILFALAAGNTAVGTILTCNSTLVVIVALDNNSRGVVYKMNNMIGTDFYTKTAADTFSRVYPCDVFLAVNADCISGANVYAVAVAEAGIGAKSVTGIIEVCRLAGFRSVIDIFSLLGKTSAVARNISDALNDITRFNTENFCNLACCAVAAGDTKIGLLSFSKRKSLCISITAGEAASTAICTGKTFSYCCSSLILSDAEKNSGDGEKHGAQSAYCQKNDYRN